MAEVDNELSVCELILSNARPLAITTGLAVRYFFMLVGNEFCHKYNDLRYHGDEEKIAEANLEVDRNFDNRYSEVAYKTSLKISKIRMKSLNRFNRR